MTTNISCVSVYTGHTDNLGERMTQHRLKAFDGYTAKYNCTRLVWFETHETRHGAFIRERRIKKWYQEWKDEMIEILNPDWRDLYEGMTEDDVYDPARRYVPLSSPLPRG